AIPRHKGTPHQKTAAFFVLGSWLLCPKLLRTDRQLVNSLACCSRDCICESPSRKGGTRFTDATWSLGARNNVNLDFRSFVVPDHRIVVEVMLHDPAVLDCDFAFQSRRQTVKCPAFHLGLDRVRIDHPARVDSAPHLMDTHGPVGYGNFSHLADNAAKSFH